MMFFLNQGLDFRTQQFLEIVVISRILSVRKLNLSVLFQGRSSHIVVVMEMCSCLQWIRHYVHNFFYYSCMFVFGQLLQMCTIILSALNYCWKSMMRLVSDVLLVQIRIYPLCLSNLLVNGDVLQCYWITFFVCGIVSNMFILNPI